MLILSPDVLFTSIALFTPFSAKVILGDIDRNDGLRVANELNYEYVTRELFVQRL